METSCPRNISTHIIIIEGKNIRRNINYIDIQSTRVTKRSSRNIINSIISQLFTVFLLYFLLCCCTSSTLSAQESSVIPKTSSFPFRQNVSSTLTSSSLSKDLSQQKTSSSLDPPFPCVENDTILIGYLTDISGDTNTKRQGLVISGAINYAVELINNRSASDFNFLRGKKLKLLHADTRGDTIIGTRKLLKLWNQGVVAFFGPEDSCETEAKVAASLNLPMISYKCTDSRVSDKRNYPTFARTFPPDTQVIHSVLSLLDHFDWKKFSLIYESTSPFESVALSLSRAVKARNLTINSEKSYANFYLCCERKADCCMNPFLSIVNTTYEGTRVYVFIGRETDLIKFMLILRTRGILDNGEYVVLYVDLESYVREHSYKYLYGALMNPADARAATEAAKSLLVIVPSPPADSHYSDFEDRVREYNEKPPFNFKRNEIVVLERNRKKFITIYASYLFDAVNLYVDALSTLFNQTESSKECLNNGSLIIDTIIKRKRYTSITGAGMKIDSSGDAEGNYTVLSLQPVPPDLEFVGLGRNWKPTDVMLPVGFFEYDGNSSLTKLKLTGSIDWVGKRPPLDEPPCGFDGSKCRPPQDNRREIIAGVLTGLFMTCSLIAAVVYRNWKYEQEIAGLLWRISMKDLVELQSNNSSKNPGMFNTFGGSRLSINSQASNELCGGGQIFTVLRKYRGSVVAVKSLRFPQVRRVEIPREVKKEMKLMKEIHHGNINPFIGAVVQPNQVLIVTEYCGKGSLHDVLENDSVKLDAMFIASLVFDLINAMIYLHESFLKMHGNLKSHNCLITSRFVLQVSDFGLHHLRKTCDVVSENVDKHRKDLWKAPELLRDQTLYGSQKGDVYAFALILHEIFARNGPFGIDKNEDDDDECDEEEDDTERDEGCSSIGSTACDEEAITDAGANMELRNEGSSSLRNHQRMNRDNREGLFLRFRDERDDEKGDEEGRCRENSCREPDCSDERESHEVDQPHTQSVITKSSSCAVNALQDNRIKSGRQKRKRKLTAGDIICLVKDETRVEPFRPDVSDIEAQDFVLMTMKNCWHEDPNKRPDFRPIKESLKNMRHGLKSNVFDNMMIMMEKHNNNLEELVEERTIQLLEEKKKTEHLLHQMLPASVANDLMKGKMVTPETFEAVTIFFSDIVGFTAMCSESTPMEVVNFLHDLYQLFDDIISHYDVYKVETIGDAYMVVSGLPIKNGDKHATEIASMAIELLDNVKHFKIRHRPNDTLQLRIGIHTGGVVAGVVGKTMPRYCLFGDTVNTASRYESNGEALKIHISPQLRDYLVKYDMYIMEERGFVRMKGKGEVMTYWLMGHKNPEGMSRRKEPPMFDIFAYTGKIPLSRRGSIVTFKGDNTLATSASQVNLSTLFSQRRPNSRINSSISSNNPWASSPKIARKLLKSSRVHSREPSLEGLHFSRGTKLLPMSSRRSQTSLSMHTTNNNLEIALTPNNSAASSTSGLTGNRIFVGNEIPPKIPIRKLTTVLSEDEEEETRAGLDIGLLTNVKTAGESRSRRVDKKTSNQEYLKNCPSFNKQRQMSDSKKWLSLNEVFSGSDSRISRNSSLSSIPNQNSYIPLSNQEVDNDFNLMMEPAIATNSSSPFISSAKKKYHLPSWIGGLVRKTSSDPNLEQQNTSSSDFNQKLVMRNPFPVKESVIETNV